MKLLLNNSIRYVLYIYVFGLTISLLPFANTARDLAETLAQVPLAGRLMEGFDRSILMDWWTHMADTSMITTSLLIGSVLYFLCSMVVQCGILVGIYERQSGFVFMIKNGFKNLAPLVAISLVTMVLFLVVMVVLWLGYLKLLGPPLEYKTEYVFLSSLLGMVAISVALYIYLGMVKVSIFYGYLAGASWQKSLKNVLVQSIQMFGGYSPWVLLFLVVQCLLFLGVLVVNGWVYPWSWFMVQGAILMKIGMQVGVYYIVKRRY